jgi:hypothetical protein
MPASKLSRTCATEPNIRDPPDPPNVPQKVEFWRMMMGEVEERGLCRQYGTM